MTEAECRIPGTPGTPPAVFASERLAKALSHPLRVKILDELNRRAVMSPSEFHDAFAPDEELSTVAKHFRILVELDCIEVIEEKTGGKRRGSTEHFYRAKRRSLFDKATWDALPDSMKNGTTGAAFQTYIDRVSEAFEHGTIDSRPDRHFTWTDVVYDEIAWGENIEDLDDLFKRLFVRQRESRKRLKKSGEQPIYVTVGLAGFESPPAPGARTECLMRLPE